MYLALKDRLAQEPQIEKLFHEVEMPLVGVLVDMECHGVSIDTRRCGRCRASWTRR